MSHLPLFTLLHSYNKYMGLPHFDPFTIFLVFKSCHICDLLVRLQKLQPKTSRFDCLPNFVDAINIDIKSKNGDRISGVYYPSTYNGDLILFPFSMKYSQYWMKRLYTEITNKCQRYRVMINQRKY